jgi:phage shock protein PspC (stress-responsive transcriptional regulator)
MDETIIEKRTTTTPEIIPTLQWVRASDGLIGGVCKGMCDSFGFPVWALRLAWLFLLLWFGTGAFLYIICWIAFPREDKIPEALQGKIFGVCSKLSVKFDLEIGLVRLIAILLLLSSGGLVILAYIVAAMLLSDEPRPSATREERHKKFYSN